MNDIFLNPKQIKQETDNELLNYALHYSRCGFPVIQLQNIVEKRGVLQCSCRDGANCSVAGKHPRTRFGSNDATTDEDKIFDWWQRQPQSNIGLLTGKESGFFVLDIDIRTESYPVYNGELSLEEMQNFYRLLMKEFVPLSNTLIAYSGSGSRHHYFKYPIDLTIKNSASEIGSDFGLGLDIKADGNYIVAPPSSHKSGNKYKWFGVNTAFEDAPSWLIYEIQLAMKTKVKKSTLIPHSKSKQPPNENIPVGKRNDYLFRKISGLVNSFPKEEVLRRALEINEKQFTEPLKRRDVMRVADWCWNQYGKDLGVKK